MSASVSLTTTVTKRDGRAVVVKSGSGTAARSRLALEARWLKELAHPGVVEFLDEVPGETSELVLAYGGAQTLATANPPLERLARFLAALCSVISDLHDLGVAHNRIEGDHVIVTDAGHVCLCSFASARPVTGPVAASSEATEDVRQLGELIVELVATHPEPQAIPTGPRWSLGRRNNDEALRGCLLNVADRARADEVARRPTARQLAASLSEIAPVAGDRTTARTTPPDDPRSAPSPPIDDPAGDRTVRRSALVIVAIALAVVSGAALVLKGVSSLGGGADARPSIGTTAPPVEPGPVATAEQASCNESSGDPSADVDGDGCPETLYFDNGTIRVEGRRYEVGAVGDAMAVGDWDCDGMATPAVLRPDTGQVYVFDRWAELDEELTARLVGSAPGAEDLDTREETDCPTLVPLDAQGNPIPMIAAD